MLPLVSTRAARPAAAGRLDRCRAARRIAAASRRQLPPLGLGTPGPPVAAAASAAAGPQAAVVASHRAARTAAGAGHPRATAAKLATAGLRDAGWFSPPPSPPPWGEDLFMVKNLAFHYLHHARPVSSTSGFNPGHRNQELLLRSEEVVHKDRDHRD